MLKNNHRKPNFVNARRADDEPLVRNGLAITPSQMEEMAAQGMAISSANLASIDTDGTSNNDFYIAPERQRSTDPLVDTFNASMDVRSKAKRVKPEFDRQVALNKARIDAQALVDSSSSSSEGGD